MNTPSELGDACVALAQRSADPVGTGGFDAHDVAFGMALARSYEVHGSFTEAEQEAARRLLVPYRSRPGPRRPRVPEGVHPLLAGIAGVKAPPVRSGGTLTSGTAAKPASDQRPLVRRSVDIRFDVVSGRIRGHTPYALKDECKKVPGGRWNKDVRCWEWDAGPIAATALAEVFGPFKPRWDQAFDDLLHTVERAGRHKIATNLPDIPGLKTVAWTHQRQAYYFAEAVGSAAALFMDMGTGKSLVVVASVVNHGGLTVIACPNKVLGVWPREFRRHAAAEVHVENGVRPKRGGGHRNLTVAERTAAFSALRTCECGQPHVAIVNYEATIHEPLKSLLTATDWDLKVLDESHRIKAYNSAISKHLAKVTARRSLALTGTPMPHLPLDVFGQYRAIAPSIFGYAYTAFAAKYAVFGGYEDREFRHMNEFTEDDFHTKVFSIAFRVEADDVLDLPPVLPDQHLSITMGGAQAKAYRDVERDMLAEFGGQTVTDLVTAVVEGRVAAKNVLGKLLYLREITGGAIKDESGRTVIVGDAKARLLADWMEDFPSHRHDPEDPSTTLPAEPLVVYCEFIADLDVVRSVATAQGRRYGEVSGRHNDLTTDSEYPPHIDVLGVQIRSGGSGVDLTRACYAAYYSLGYSLGDYEQSRKRVIRPGQTRPVRFTHLVCEGTIDAVVLAVLAERAVVIDATLNRATS